MPDIVREGASEGAPSVLFDPIVRANFHLDRKGARVYHALPEGWEFDAAGELRPLADVEASAAAPVSLAPKPEPAEEPITHEGLIDG
jgi:hypothetical protein